MQTRQSLSPFSRGHTSPSSSCAKRKCSWEGEDEGKGEGNTLKRPCTTAAAAAAAAAAKNVQFDKERYSYSSNELAAEPQSLGNACEVDSQKLKSRSRRASRHSFRHNSASTGSRNHFESGTGKLGAEQPRVRTQQLASSSLWDKTNREEQDQDDTTNDDAQVDERHSERRQKNTADLTEKQTLSENFGPQVDNLENNPGPAEPPPLSDEGSQRVQEVYEEVMASVKSTKALKRRASFYSSAQSESEIGANMSGFGTEQSQQSRITEANYRYETLKAHGIYVHIEPPQHLRAAIGTILDQKNPENNCENLDKIARDLHKSCVRLVGASVREDAFVHFFLDAINAMGISELSLLEKTDWKKELKPVAKRSGWTFRPLRGSNDLGVDFEVDKRSDRPAVKCQQSSGPAYASPETSTFSVTAPQPKQSESVMLPPALPKKIMDNLSLKNPSPDIAVGVMMPCLISSLSSTLSRTLSPAKLRNIDIERIISDIQNIVIKSKNESDEEARVVMVPTQQSSDLVFPFCVVEGKAYSTGRQIFEAQNQAAVAGACSLGMQRHLDDLVTLTTVEQASNKDETSSPFFFFSVCTEGPYHELWAHYMYFEAGGDKFGQFLLEVCNLMLPESVVKFVNLVYKVMRWGVGSFLDSIVERLSRVVQSGLD